MKRVLHVLNALNNSGIESFIMNIYRNIDRTKVQFDFLLTGEKAAYDDEVEALGGKIYRHVLHGSRLKLVSIYKKELKKLSKSYDTIHIHAMSCKVFFVARYAKKYGMKNVIVHCHGCGHSGPVHKILQFLLNHYSNIQISCSDVAGETMFGKKKMKDVIIIPNVIDTNKFSFDANSRIKVRKMLNIEENEIAYVSVGRFSYEKNHEFMLEVFKRIINLEKNSKLFLIGWGDLEKEIIKKINDLGLNEKVVILGSRNDVYYLLNGMDAFLLPSLFEGMPVTVIESQVNGLPVFLTSSITRTVMFTNLLNYISLNEDADLWAKRIVTCVHNYERCDHSAEASQAGFEVTKTALRIQNYYLNNCENYYEK